MFRVIQSTYLAARTLAGMAFPEHRSTVNVSDGWPDVAGARQALVVNANAVCRGGGYRYAAPRGRGPENSTQLTADGDVVTFHVERY